MQNPELKDRCLHTLDSTWHCTKCGGSYWDIKDDPRPWSVIKQERLEKKKKK